MRRHWTVVVVGDDTDAPRTFRLSSRVARAAGWGAGAVLTAIVAVSLAGGIAYGRYRTLTRPTADTIPSDPAVALALVRDSIASLGRQTVALRVVAGLGDSSAANDTTTALANAPVDTLIHRADRLSADLQAVASKLRGDAEKVGHTPSIMPTPGWISSQFSMSRFHPILHKHLPHLGLDIAAPYGTTIVAPAAGKVIRAGLASGYGWVMEIDHGNGIVTKYGHLSKFLARLGQTVVRGQAIAQVGNSGLATGPHLHYEVHVNGTIVDPLTYVLPSTIPDVIREDSRVPGAPED